MKDKYRVYNYEGDMAGNTVRHIENADPTTFKVIDYLFARDKDTVFRALQSSYVWIDIQEAFELMVDEQYAAKVKIGRKEYPLDFTGDDPHVVGLPKDKKISLMMTFQCNTCYRVCIKMQSHDSGVSDEKLSRILRDSFFLAFDRFRLCSKPCKKVQFLLGLQKRSMCFLQAS